HRLFWQEHSCMEYWLSGKINITYKIRIMLWRGFEPLNPYGTGSLMASVAERSCRPHPNQRRRPHKVDPNNPNPRLLVPTNLSLPLPLIMRGAPTCIHNPWRNHTQSPFAYSKPS